MPELQGGFGADVAVSVASHGFEGCFFFFGGGVEMSAPARNYENEDEDEAKDEQVAKQRKRKISRTEGTKKGRVNETCVHIYTSGRPLVIQILVHIYQYLV